MMAPTPAQPDEFGEDLTGNFRDVVAVARRHCSDCMDYHVVHAAVRLAGRRPSLSADRGIIVDIIGGLLAGRTEADILIAGSADAGLLATVARAVRRVAPGNLAGFRITVIDRCGTPLEFCRRFAERHGLTVATAVADLADPPAGLAADVVLMHGVLRFLPADRHVAALAALGRRLRPGGRIVLSQRIGGRAGPPAIHRERLLAMAAAGTIVLPEPEPAFIARLDRYLGTAHPPRTEYGDERDLVDVLAQAGLWVVERRSLTDLSRPLRLVAVLGPQ